MVTAQIETGPTLTFLRYTVPNVESQIFISQLPVLGIEPVRAAWQADVVTTTPPRSLLKEACRRRRLSTLFGQRRLPYHRGAIRACITCTTVSILF